jgi:hypothetical protein
MGAHLGALFTILGACDVTLGSPFWPATLQPLALVPNPRLGLQHLYIIYRQRPLETFQEYILIWFILTKHTNGKNWICKMIWSKHS